MKKHLGIIFLGIFLIAKISQAKTKNIGNGLSINVPNNYKYFELTFRQLVSRFPEIGLNDQIYEDFGIGIGSKLIVIANNQKTINFFDDVTSVSGLEKLNRKHVQPLIKKVSDPKLHEGIMKDLQKMYSNKNFNTMSEDELMDLMMEFIESPKMIKKYERIFKPYFKKFSSEYKLDKYTVLLIGDEMPEDLIEEINSQEIPALRQDLLEWFDELYSEYKDPSLKSLTNWEFEISRTHSGNLYFYSNESLQSPYVSNQYNQELFLTTYKNKIFLALSICVKKCNGSTDFLNIIKPTNLYVKTSSGTGTESSNDIVEKLETLNELYKSGALTKEEFEKAKKKLLN